MIAWELEDYLQSKEVYTNALNGSIAHSDSYMTVTNFDKLYLALEDIRDKYTIDQWRELHDYFDSQSYLSPNLCILASVIKRKIIDNQ